MTIYLVSFKVMAGRLNVAYVTRAKGRLFTIAGESGPV